MEKYNTAIFYRYLILFFSISLLLNYEAQAQNDNSQSIDSTKVDDTAISIANISGESERLGKRLMDIVKILKPSAEIHEVDSILNIVSVAIIVKKDSLLIQFDNMNRRELKVNQIEWNNNRSRVKKNIKILKSRTENLSDINDELVQELRKWELTKKDLINTSESEDVYTSLDLVIKTIQETLQLTHERLDSIFIIQKRLTNLILTIDETISEIELVELQMQKEYFVIDSKPLWRSKNIGITVIDSTSTDSISATKQILSGLKENKDQLKEFLSLHVKTVILQVFFILILLVLTIGVSKKWKKDLNNITNPIEIQAKIVLSYPLSATIVVGVLISAFFYDALIPAFGELHVMLILIGTVILLPKLTSKRFSLFLVLVIIAYLIHILQAYLGPKALLIRWLMIIDAIVLISSFMVGRNAIRRSPEHFTQIYKTFKIIGPFYILILLLAILANIIGMVSLSKFLIAGVITSTVLGMIVYLSVKVITNYVVLFFKLRGSYNMQTLSTMVNANYHRIQPILNWVGMLVWLMFTLKGFDVFDFIVRWINELMLMKWAVGEMTISLGGILAFLSIFIVTLVLAKLAATIFQDEWMIKVLPRGVAPAISLVLRIVLITIGFYMALSAAGLDLSKLGFIVGALGVGIGFGLQSVVLNFIAGLILAFERPINLGDTIEVDQERGVVTSIGVRSSNIRSYSGYEAIIPNGDLISKKVLNFTLTNRDRRSSILMKTAPNVDPEKVIKLFNQIASEHPKTYKDPAPLTYFNGYSEDGNLMFNFFYWTSFSDTLEADHEIALKIYATLKEMGIQAPVPVRRIINK